MLSPKEITSRIRDLESNMALLHARGEISSFSYKVLKEMRDRLKALL